MLAVVLSSRFQEHRTQQLLHALQIRDAYKMVKEAKANYLKEHPELDSKDTAAEAGATRQAPSENGGRTLARKLSSRTSFK